MEPTAVNCLHYNLDKLSPELRKIAETGKLPWPCFVGQGCSCSIGSDCYGYYVTYVSKTAKGKPLIGLTRANEKMRTCWEEGSMDCSIDIDKAEPQTWITTFGKTKTGAPKWWFCDKDGMRFNGQRCRYSWNGAHGYRSPSF